MRETAILCLRRMLNSPYHPYQTIPKSDIWWKRERMHRFTAWSFGERRDTVRAAYRHLNKIFFYRSIQRDDKYPLMRHWSDERVTIALDEHRMPYKHFRAMLDKSNIYINNSILAQLAIYEPRTFKSVVMLTKELAEQDQRAVIHDDDNQSQVRVTRAEIFGPNLLERSRVYAKGSAVNHKQRARQLRKDEY